MIDLRSDTATRPTPGMRAAIAAAEVGDDVYGEDPTVRALEERVADLLGVEAALFVPSGTMANQLALRVLGRPGEEVLIGRDAHCWRFESGALAALAGLQTQVLPGDGRFDAAARRSSAWTAARLRLGKIGGIAVLAAPLAAAAIALPSTGAGPASCGRTASVVAEDVSTGVLGSRTSGLVPLNWSAPASRWNSGSSRWPPAG